MLPKVSEKLVLLETFEDYLRLPKIKQRLLKISEVQKIAENEPRI